MCICIHEVLDWKVGERKVRNGMNIDQLQEGT